MSRVKSLVLLAAVSLAATASQASQLPPPSVKPQPSKNRQVVEKRQSSQAKTVTYQRLVEGTCRIPTANGDTAKIGMDRNGKGLFVSCLPVPGIMVVTEMNVDYKGNGVCEQKSARTVHARFVDPVQCVKITSRLHSAKSHVRLAIEEDGTVRLAGGGPELRARPTEKVVVDGIKDAAKELDRAAQNTIAFVQVASRFVAYKVKKAVQDVGREIGSVLSRGYDPSLCDPERDANCRTDGRKVGYR